ncbi:hypothetical protein C0Q70_08414 [Pomacea canaliculata]|uniref:Uncharacterized protein n=1 Tax=Pomacea canaliculata TaxID=400727 RepID=A0A2T7PHR6_POMCA|nr:hypothetical protein C0Q70_08414 [Pomacea canaliculata]
MFVNQTSELPESVSNQATEDLDATAREIERQSAHIQRDMERERRARSVSPIRCLTSSPATLPPRPARPATPARLQTTTTDYGSVNYDSGDVFASSPTVNKDVSENTALFTTRLQLKAAEKEAKEMRDKAEEARSQLMLLEFKRSTAAKELDRLIDEISRKKGMSQLYDSEVQAKLSEIRGFQALGISMETVRLLQEENDTLKLRQRGLRTAELERDELSRQLEAAKEDLLREQKQARLQREELSEEIETLTARLEETQNNLSIAQRTTDKLEDAFRQMEREKNELIQETTKEYAALKVRANQESKESRQLMTREVEVINEELQELRVRVNDLLADNKMKEEQNSQLRENLNALQSQLSQEQASRAAVTEDHRKTLQMLRKETDTAMLQLRESLFLDKQRALEELRAEVESERRDSTSRADERMAQLLGENAALLSEKNQEIARLQEKVRDVQRSVDRRVQEVTDQKMREAVVRESARLESESQWKLRAEREAMTRDAKQMVDEMKMALDQEKELTHHLKREVSQMKEELEEQRRQSREAQKEKLMAVARAKEQTREQGSLELEKVKEKVRQDMQREVDRVQSQLRQAEDEIRTLKSEKQQIVSREKDSQASLDRVEKTVINELNEECRRGATALGVSPRQVQLSAVTESTSTRAQITAALANLRAVNEELRNHIQELSTELERCRSVISELEKEKVEVAEGVRLEMDKKRVLELDRLKEKLSKEHAEELAKVAQASARQSLANSMVTALRRKDQEIEELKNSLQTWRDQTAEKVAHLYKTELARELENGHKNDNPLRKSATWVTSLFKLYLELTSCERVFRSQAVVSQNNFEQKQVNEMQQREIDRLEREVQRLAMVCT